MYGQTLWWLISLKTQKMFFQKLSVIISFCFPALATNLSIFQAKAWKTENMLHMLDLIMVLPVSIFKVILKIIDNVIAYLLRWDQKLVLDKKKSNNIYLPQEVSVFAASLSLRESKRTSMVYGAIQSLTEYINKLQIYYMKISQVRILVMCLNWLNHL